MWNHYRIRLIGSDLTLEVNGEIQNTASWCERIPGAIALQSEGVMSQPIILFPLPPQYPGSVVVPSGFVFAFQFPMSEPGIYVDW